MGLLAPLYALAALAIAAPIIFHLIRRQPRGQSEFSSLMFLQPSPPRLTRRSRLDNLLLLLLRALALLLIALAFARPFMRSVELADQQLATREILLLVDISGSMQRPDVWQRAIASAKEYVDGLGEADQLGLATFDSKLSLRVPLTKQGDAATSARAQQAAVQSELGKLKPTYQSTRLADSLMAAVELLQERSTAAVDDDHQREIVLISDLHEGSGIEALQGFAWPEGVRLDVRKISPVKSGNARANLMQTSAADAASTTTAGERENTIRVRVENNKSSENVDFQLQWVGANNGAPQRLQVPPGQARVVPVPLPTGTSSRLVLTGDSADFDNVLEVPRTAPRQEHILFVGQTQDKPEEDLFFFLSQVPFSTPVRNVTVDRATTEQLAGAETDAGLAGVAIEAPLLANQIELIQRLVESGKPVVIVLSRPVTNDSPETAATAEVLSKLLGSVAPVRIGEAESNKFGLWTEIDFRHPLFLPLAEAKFNDFGKVRFWNHRQLEVSDGEVAFDESLPKNYRVLARFDDGLPAVIHRKLGRGDLWVLTAGWQATSSQLSLSTKFVPLMFGMFDLQGQSMVVDAVYEVGEVIPVGIDQQFTLTTSEGTPIDVSDDRKLTLDTPGLYWLTEEGKRRQIAVVLPMTESQLDPIDTERFQQYGVVTGKSNSAEELRASSRLSKVHELEGRQKLWRWILVGAIALLIIETVVAWRQSLSVT